MAAPPASRLIAALSLALLFLFDLDATLFLGRQFGLALQLPFCFEVRALSGSLVRSTPERPCDDVCGLDPLPSEPDCDAADFLD